MLMLISNSPSFCFLRLKFLDVIILFNQFRGLGLTSPIIPFFKLLLLFHNLGTLI